MVERVAYKIVLVSVCLGMCVMAQAQGQLSDSRLPGELPPPYVSQWGSAGSGDSQFDLAFDLATDASGNIYVVDTYNYRIQKFDSSGTFERMWGWGVDDGSNEFQVCTGSCEIGVSGGGGGQFKTPGGVVVDSSGNVYVADTLNHRIQKFDSSGTFVSTWGWGVDTGAGGLEVCTAATVPCQAGTSGTGNGQFNQPWNVGVGPSGDVYVGDMENDRVQVFDSSGNYLRQWGSYGSGDGNFHNPGSVAVDATGSVYVADTWNDRVQKFDSTGNFLTKWGSTGTGDGQFNGGVGTMSVDASGNLYVADWNNHRVQKFDGSGTFLTKWGTSGSGDGQFNQPRGTAVDASGNVYVTDMFNRRIQKFGFGSDPNELVFLGKWGTSGAGGAAIQGEFATPNGMAVDASGNVYVADKGNDRVQKFDSSGAFVSMWGWGVDTGASGFEVCTAASTPCGGGISGSGDGQFNAAHAVAVDASGNIYVVDQYNHRIQKFNSSLTYLTQWGGNGSAAGKFNAPYAVAIDSSGNVYVSDFNHRVQKFDSSGNFISMFGWSVNTGASAFEICTAATVPCQAGTLGSGDGQFKAPQGLAVDTSGNIYVLDTLNYRVQKFNSSFAFQRMWGWGVDDGTSEFQICESSCEAGTTGSGDGQFNQHAAAAVDASGNLFVADGYNSRVQKFDGSGNFLTKWGGLCQTSVSGANGCDSRYYRVLGVATGPAGVVYTPDYNDPHSRIQKFGPCSFAAVPTSDTIVFGGGADQFDVDAIVEACGWKPTSNDSWIHVTAPPSYIGDETVDYSVDANPTGLARAGTITVADQTTGGAGATFTVNQDHVHRKSGPGALYLWPDPDLRFLRRYRRLRQRHGHDPGGLCLDGREQRRLDHGYWGHPGQWQRHRAVLRGCQCGQRRSIRLHDDRRPDLHGDPGPADSRRAQQPRLCRRE